MNASFSFVSVPLTAYIAAVALGGCGKSEPAPEPAAAASTAQAAALSAQAPTSAPTAEASTAVAAALTSASATASTAAAVPTPSTDADVPTPLPAKQIKGQGTGSKATYYYGLKATGGLVKLTATGRNAPSGATIALQFGLYDLKANALCGESLGNTTADKTVAVNCSIDKAQPVILRLDLSEETLTYAVEVDGAFELPPAQAATAPAPIAGAGSTDIDEPTRLKTNRVKGEGPRKAVTYYYAFNAGPGELTLTSDGKNVAAATTEALITGLYTLRSERLCESSLGNTTLEKRSVVTCKIETRQPVILRLDLSADTTDFRVRFEGAYDFEEFTAPKAVTIALDAAVLFDSGASTLKPEARKTLDEAAARVKKFADAPVTIAGHTDSVGSDVSNQKLSENRAAAVRDYFVAQAGVPAARLSAKGFGKSQPVADNKTDEGRARNRRVEVQISPK